MESAGGSYVHDAGSLVEMGQKEQAEKVRCRDSNPQYVVEILIAAAGEDASLGEAGIVDQVIHLAVGVNNLLHKLFQYFLFSCVSVEKQSFAACLADQLQVLLTCRFVHVDKGHLGA